MNELDRYIWLFRLFILLGMLINGTIQNWDMVGYCATLLVVSFIFLDNT